jgi:hypothetical protein
MEATTDIVNEGSIIVIKVLATALATLAAIYLPRLWGLIERKLGKDVPDAIEDESQRLALRAILRAEELGRKHAKKLGDRLPHKAKLEAGAAYFRDHARAPVIKWLGDKVEDYLEERLGAYRADAGPRPTWVDADPEEPAGDAE